MSQTVTLIFPGLIYLETYGGDFSVYFNAVYKIFEKDFIKRNLLLTAYYIVEKHRIRKLIKEYEAFKKAETAQGH